MGHDAHFLQRLDRVEREELDLALSLYRDHEGVAHVLRKFNWPESAERIAIAIDHGSNGPFIVITRAGNFVTCLGKGMSPAPHPVMPRSQLDALLLQHATVRAREKAAVRERRVDDDELITRIYRRANLLAREDFEALSFFAPMLFRHLLMQAQEVALMLGKQVVLAAAVLRGARRLTSAAETQLQRLHELRWSVGHFTMLAGTADREVLEEWLTTMDRLAPATVCLSTLTSGIWFRGWWTTARAGRSQLAPLKRLLAKTESEWLIHLNTIGALMTIAFRHKAAMAEVQKVVASFETHQREAGREYQAEMAALALAILSGRDDLSGPTLNVGRTLFSAALAEVTGETIDETDVTDDDARTMILHSEWPVSESSKLEEFALRIAPIVADAPAEAFYFSRATRNRVLAKTAPEDICDWVMQYASESPAPVKVEARVGRNDPCTCGSGKKWKKCCGANA